MTIQAVEQVVTDEYALYLGDSCELIQAIPDNSIHFGLHSPPFEGLYKFSNSERDLSNSEGDLFWQHYGFLIREVLRVTMPGRIHAVHVMNLPATKVRNGYIGVRDFRGEVIQAWQDAGWIFHGETCINKDPVVAMQRTKSIRLLHAQIKKDSCISGPGLADYIVAFRKPGENPEPVGDRFDLYIGTDGWAVERDARSIAGRGHAWEEALSIAIWQRYAAPVWNDIDQTRTLQYRAGRDDKDEQHISPLQLDVIERCIDLWSNPGDVVFSPFAGIGSEICAAVEMGRRGLGIELKPSYYAQAVKNLQGARSRTDDLFASAS